MFPTIVGRLREMPSTLAAMTVLFSILGTFSIVAIFLPGWKYKEQPVTYAELWWNGGAFIVLTCGVTMLVFARAFYRARTWVQYAVPLGFGGATIGFWFWPYPQNPPAWIGTLVWTGLSYWYFLRKRNVVAYFKTQMQVD